MNGGGVPNKVFRSSFDGFMTSVYKQRVYDFLLQATPDYHVPKSFLTLPSFFLLVHTCYDGAIQQSISLFYFMLILFICPSYRLWKLERSYIFTTPPGLTLGCLNLQPPSSTSCLRCGSLGASTLTRGLWWCTAAQASAALEPSVSSTPASYWSVLDWEFH